MIETKSAKSASAEPDPYTPPDPLSLPCSECGAPPGEECECGAPPPPPPLLDLRGVLERAISSAAKAADRASWEAYACAWIASRANVHSTEQVHVIRGAIQIADAMLAESRRRFG